MNDLPIDRLAQYPWLSFAAAVMTLVGLAFAVYRGSRDRQTPPPPSIGSPEQRYFFDGPIGEALKLMRDQRNILNEIKEHVAPLGELGRNTNKELGEIKHEVQTLKEIKAAGRRR